MIVEVYVRKLLGLFCLKNVDGFVLLEFSRYLDIVDWILIGMGVEYVFDLNYMNILWEFVKKLLMFLRGRWIECVGKIIGFGCRFKF